MKKHLLAAGVASVIGVTGIGAGVAHAATNSSSSSENAVSSTVDAIATKFNVNKEDVQKVFEEQHEKRHADREQAIKEELTQAVSDGKLTQAQADAIQLKRAEIYADREANRDKMKDLSREERKAKMQERKTELESWAKENNIDSQYLHYAIGHGKGGPGGHHR